MCRKAAVIAVIVSVVACWTGASSVDAGQVVARTQDGTVVTQEELDAAIGNKLLLLKYQEYEQRRRALRELLAERLLDQEARRRNLSRAVLEEREFDEKIVPATDVDVAVAYNARRAQFAGRPEAEVHKEIRDMLRARQRRALRSAFVQTLMDRAGARILLEPPRVAVEPGDDPARGQPGAPVTIVVFSDFQCPYCSRVEGPLARVAERYPTQVRVVYKDFPLQSHKEAPLAAEAARCAGEQGKYWEMRERLYSSQADLSEEVLTQQASQLALKGDDFKACLQSRRFADTVRTNKAAGDRYGVAGTPGFFVNGRFATGALTFETLVEMVEEELARLQLPTIAPAATLEKSARPD